MKRKITSIFIIFFMMISYFFPIMSFGNYEKYIALGDSIPQGFGLEDIDAYNYTEKLRQKCNISKDNYKNLSISCQTTVDFYNKIRESNYTEEISQADLLTISIGSNEILDIVAEAVSVATGIDKDDEAFSENFLEAAKQAFLKADMIEKLNMIVTLYNYCTTEDIKAKIDSKILVYEEYWTNSINYIKQINPDATIVVTDF